MKRSVVVIAILLFLGEWLPSPFPLTEQEAAGAPEVWFIGGIICFLLMVLFILLAGRTAAVYSGPPMRIGGLKDHEAATYLASRGAALFSYPDLRLTRLARVLLTGWFFVGYGDGALKRQWCFLTPAYLASYQGEPYVVIEYLVLQGGANDLLLTGARILTLWETRTLWLPEGGIPLSSPFPVVAREP